MYKYEILIKDIHANLRFNNEAANPVTLHSPRANVTWNNGHRSERQTGLI